MDKQKFYGQKITFHRFLRDAALFTDDLEDANSVITGPVAGGDKSGIEHLNDDNLADGSTMLEGIASEVDVFYEEPSETCRATGKKQKRDHPKWKCRHTTPQPDLIHEKKDGTK